MPQDAEANSQKPGDDWAGQVDVAAKSDNRVRPWETVVESTDADTSEGDVIDLNVNPQGACDISVSA